MLAVVRCGVLILAWIAACAPAEDERPVCIDEDFDAYGSGCALGPDCDDQDPARAEDCSEPAPPPPDCVAAPLSQGCPCVRGDRQACFPAAAERADVGRCRSGVTVCSDGEWGACEGAIAPGSEVCNAIDDDCDGYTDEGVVSPCGGCNSECRGGVWGPPTVPFEAAPPLALTQAGELTLQWRAHAAQTLWVPNTDEGSVSKLDPRTARELARYRTRGGYPIRVAVDHRGDAWVLDGTFGGRAYLTRFAGEPARCRDRDGDGVRTSTSGAELLALGSDECVLLELPLADEDDPQTLAVDGALDADGVRAGNPWLGMAGTRALVELDASSGQERGRYALPEFEPLASAFDPFGALWLIDRAGWLLRFDPGDDSALTRLSVPFECFTLEALSIDGQGDLLLSGFGCERVFAYEPGRKLWRTLMVPGLQSPRGIVALSDKSWLAYDSGQIAQLSRSPLEVSAPRSLASAGFRPFETLALSADGAGQVWAISTQGGPNGEGLATRFDRENGQVTAQVPVGFGPRASGDFTGFASGGQFETSGSATHVFGGCGREARDSNPVSLGATRWLRVHVAAVLGRGASLGVAVRRADDAAGLADVAFETVGELPSDEAAFELSVAPGGVLEVQLTLRSPVAIGAPRVARVGVEWECPGPD